MSKKKQETNVSRRNFIVKSAAVGVGATALAGLTTNCTQQQSWDRVADVIVIGAGAAGLPAAIEAVNHGATVIMVDENVDIGGHMMLNGGQLPLGGGTSTQKKYGIQDSPDQVYLDLTRPDNPQTRFNDRELARAFADNSAATFEFVLENGGRFIDKAPEVYSYSNNGETVARNHFVAAPASGGFKQSINNTLGSGLGRPFEASAREKGVEILLQHKLTSIVREKPTEGNVLGIKVKNLADGKDVSIRASKAVVIASGGHNDNLNFRRIFDPRLTEEFYVSATPYVKQTAGGQLAALAIGASLWGTGGQTNQADLQLFKPFQIGCLDGLIMWNPESPYFQAARASGLGMSDWQDVIIVSQTGVRFCDEVNTFDYYKTPGEYYSFLSTLMATVVQGDGGARRVGAPVWAIFDADALAREKWDPKPPNVDPELFFSADTIAELAGKIKHKYQLNPMPAQALQDTVTKFNSYVDARKDSEFGRTALKYKIQKPPFYAAWCVPTVHDTVTGLRINARAQVMDLQGQIIPRLYAAGECAGGFGLHGMPRAFTFGRIAGINAAAETQIA